MRNAIAATTAVALTMSSVAAHAFCGFYVSGSDKKMFNDATNVVLMRSGTRTVLSMQNDYRGPLEDFAMVVPVPVVLKQSDVKVVPKAVLDRIDSLGSPRLVEYWEQDPCPMPIAAPMADYRMRPGNMAPSRAPSVAMKSSAAGGAREDSMAADEARPRAVPPQLASFSVHPPSVTAGVATPMTWTWQYSNQPYPEPVCQVDHGQNGVA